MLRDRMPMILDLALSWCKAKGRWIDHVYEYVIKRYPQQKRGTAVKTVLGIKQQFKRQEIYDYFRYVKLMDVNKNQMFSIPKDDLFMRFYDTIDWDNIEDEDMYQYWKTVNDWVVWFRTTYAKIEDTYSHSLHLGIDRDTIIASLMTKYGMNKKLTLYIINSIK